MKIKNKTKKKLKRKKVKKKMKRKNKKKEKKEEIDTKNFGENLVKILNSESLKILLTELN